MPPHQHWIKSISPKPTKKGAMAEREQRSHYLIRSLPLLVLMLYAAASVLRLAPPSPSSSPPTSSLLHPTDSIFGETGKDSESLKTHVSSNGHRLQAHEEKRVETSFSCSALIDGGGITKRSSREEGGLLCCDRSHHRTDVCYMRGDIRTDPGSSSITLLVAGQAKAPETIRPYTRKWESAVMTTINEITLSPVSGNQSRPICDVHHKGIPAVVFSTGGYTGNVYHEFNDGLIPLYITAQRFGGEVVLLVAEYHSWWFAKYRSIVQRLTNYKLVDLAADRRVHCFDEMVVGLRIHGELSIDPQLMPDGKGIQDFQALIGEGFGVPRASPVPQLPSGQSHVHPAGAGHTRPKLAIFIRNKSRVLLNLRGITRACHRIGFHVQILNPKRTTPLSDIHAALNSSDAMLAVHGAAMTHFLFMRPATVLIQIVPLGLDWPAETYYGEPARKLGLDYMAYKVAPEESSLSKVYDHRDPVLVDPAAITSKGWPETKKVYLDKQNVKVNIRKFSKLLEVAHSHIRTYT